MIARNNQIITLTPTADHTGKEGFAVVNSSGSAALVTAATQVPIGVITEGSTTSGVDSVALPGFGGTVKVKLAGTVADKDRLEITAAGEFQASTGAGTVAAVALEAGVDDELIEARLIEPAKVGSAGLITTAVGTDATGVGEIRGQVQDAAGNAILGRHIVSLYFGAAANDGTPADLGDVAADTGTVIITEHVADAYIQVLTAADGSWGVDYTPTGDDTIHTNAWVSGAVTVESTVVDVP